MQDTNFLRNLTIFSGSAMTILANTVISPALPGMAAEFKGIPGSQFLVPMSLTLPALFIALGAPFAGALLDRIGRRPVLAGALTLYGCAGLFGFFSPSLWGILGSRIFIGIAGAATMTGFTTLIADYFKGSERSRFIGYQGAAIGIGSVAALMLAGYLASIDWRLPFMIYALAFPVLLGVLFFIKEPEASEFKRPGESTEEGLPLTTLIPIYLAGLLGILIIYVFPVQLPFYLTDKMKADSNTISLALSVQTAFSILSSIKYEWASRRFSRNNLFFLAFLGFGFNHFLIALLPYYAAVIAAMAIGGLSLGLLPPTAIMAITENTPDSARGKALGVMTTAFFVGVFLAPLASQPVSSLLGFEPGFLLFGGLSFLCALFFLRTEGER